MKSDPPVPQPQGLIRLVRMTSPAWQGGGKKQQKKTKLKRTGSFGNTNNLMTQSQDSRRYTNAKSEEQVKITAFNTGIPHYLIYLVACYVHTYWV